MLKWQKDVINYAYHIETPLFMQFKSLGFFAFTSMHISSGQIIISIWYYKINQKIDQFQGLYFIYLFSFDFRSRFEAMLFALCKNEENGKASMRFFLDVSCYCFLISQKKIWTIFLHCDEKIWFEVFFTSRDWSSGEF